MQTEQFLIIVLFVLFVGIGLGAVYTIRTIAKKVLAHEKTSLFIDNVVNIRVLIPLLIFGYILFGVYYLFIGIDYGFLKSEITAYITVCTKAGQGDKCLQEEALGRLTFKVYPEQQTVIANGNGYKIMDYGDANIGHLKDCVVIDLKNWNCDDGNSGRIGFTNGNFFDTSMSIITSSKFKWSRLETYNPSTKF